MKQTWMCLVVALGSVSAYAQVAEPNDVPFMPWGALETIEDMGPSWLDSEYWIQYLYTVNDRAFGKRLLVPSGINALHIWGFTGLWFSFVSYLICGVMAGIGTAAIVAFAQRRSAASQ